MPGHALELVRRDGAADQLQVVAALHAPDAVHPVAHLGVVKRTHSVRHRYLLLLLLELAPIDLVRRAVQTDHELEMGAHADATQTKRIRMEYNLITQVASRTDRWTGLRGFRLVYRLAIST